MVQDVYKQLETDLVILGREDELIVSGLSVAMVDRYWRDQHYSEILQRNFQQDVIQPFENDYFVKMTMSSPD